MTPRERWYQYCIQSFRAWFRAWSRAGNVRFVVQIAVYQFANQNPVKNHARSFRHPWKRPARSLHPFLNIITVKLSFAIVTRTQLVGVPVFSLILTVDFNTKGNLSSECIYLGSRNDFLWILWDSYKCIRSLCLMLDTIPHFGKENSHKRSLKRIEKISLVSLPHFFENKELFDSVCCF